MSELPVILAMQKRIIALEGAVKALTERLDARPAAVVVPVKSDIEPADDHDLDGEHGNPVVKYPLKEKYWKDQPDTNVDRAWSECSATYLRATCKYLAACAFMAKKEGTPEGDKKAHWKTLDAGRALGWALRIEGGYTPPAKSVPMGGSGGFDAYAGDDAPADDPIPFIRNAIFFQLDRP